jgi:hypothetical protein
MAGNATDRQPTDESGNSASMNWVMVLWLAAFLIVVIFGVATYLLGWIFQRG